MSARPTFILGLSAYYHDSAACLLRDGEVVAAAQEERFTRRRHDAAFPAQALAWCLAEAGITADRIDHVCFYDKPVAKFGRLIETHMATAPRGLRSFLTALPVWLRRKLWTAREIEEALGGGPRVLFTEHHQAHAASAFYPSPFDEAALLTLDGVGEWATTTAGAARGRRRRGESRPVMRSTTSRCSPSCATMVPTRQCSAKKRRRTSASWSRAVVIEAPLGGRAGLPLLRQRMLATAA